jgi:hypothetical protein
VRRVLQPQPHHGVDGQPREHEAAAARTANCRARCEPPSSVVLGCPRSWPNLAKAAAPQHSSPQRPTQTSRCPRHPTRDRPSRRRRTSRRAR